MSLWHHYHHRHHHHLRLPPKIANSYSLGQNLLHGIRSNPISANQRAEASCRVLVAAPCTKYDAVRTLQLATSWQHQTFSRDQISTCSLIRCEPPVISSWKRTTITRLLYKTKTVIDVYSCTIPRLQTCHYACTVIKRCVMSAQFV